MIRFNSTQNHTVPQWHLPDSPLGPRLPLARGDTKASLSMCKATDWCCPLLVSRSTANFLQGEQGLGRLTTAPLPAPFSSRLKGKWLSNLDVGGVWLRWEWSRGEHSVGEAERPQIRNMSLESNIAHRVICVFALWREIFVGTFLWHLSYLVLNAFCDVFRKCISLMLP